MGIAIPLSVLAAVLVWVVLGKTKLGYELKATGLNKSAAKYCGMKERRNLVLTMAIAGALAGMGAGLYYLTGFEQWEVGMASIPAMGLSWAMAEALAQDISMEASIPAMGFNGIAAAFLGGLNPIGTIFASYFIQHITSGGAYVDKTMYSAQISDLISSLIIYLCGFVLFFKSFLDRRASKTQDSNVNDEKPPVAGGKGGRG